MEFLHNTDSLLLLQRARQPGRHNSRSKVLEVQIDAMKKVLGAEHGDSLAIMSNLAFTWKG